VQVARSVNVDATDGAFGIYACCLGEGRSGEVEGGENSIVLEIRVDHVAAVAVPSYDITLKIDPVAGCIVVSGTGKINRSEFPLVAQIAVLSSVRIIGADTCTQGINVSRPAPVRPGWIETVNLPFDSMKLWESLQSTSTQ
jgi:hypothetical protein